ncbi:L-threonine 3-dehydrogenase [Trametes maxima]|nr:L-threonine 3-dehydrogenase [Trametes maxima]
MKAALFYGPENVRVEDIPDPVAGPNQVKIKVAWCGICGSDLGIYYGMLSDVITQRPLPVGIGHEFSGTIVELGPGVDANKLAIGQNVAVSSNVYSLETPSTRMQGVSCDGGGLSEYVVVEQDAVYILPAHIPLDIGALIEPLTVSWHALEKAQFKAGDSVLVLGAGPIGILIVKVAKVFGASWIGVSGRGAKRCSLVREHGASVVYAVPEVTDDEIVAETFKATKGNGADVVVDCAGTQSTLDVALKAVRPGGTVMNVAGWKKFPEMNMNLCLAKEIVLSNSLGYGGAHPEVIEAVAQGKFDKLDALVTLRVPLTEFVEKGLRALTHEKDQHVKVLIHP